MEPITTKESILRNAVSLFAEKGYESVSIKIIANAAGIRASSIYNHYEGKDALLALIYKYFDEHYTDKRLVSHEYEPILRNGSAEEILQSLNYPLAEPVEMMFNTIRIVWARRYIDPAASELYQKHTIDGSFAYMREVFGRGVEIGRILMSESEIEGLAMAILSVRAFAADAVVADPNQVKWREIETGTLSLLSGLLVLSPPLD